MMGGDGGGRTSASPVFPLPWSVEFHQHGLVLRCQVVEICVAELEDVLARAARAGGTGNKDGEGGEEADNGRHDGCQPPPSYYQKQKYIQRLLKGPGATPHHWCEDLLTHSFIR